MDKGKRVRTDEERRILPIWAQDLLLRRREGFLLKNEEASRFSVEC